MRHELNFAEVSRKKSFDLALIVVEKVAENPACPGITLCCILFRRIVDISHGEHVRTIRRKFARVPRTKFK